MEKFVIIVMRMPSVYCITELSRIVQVLGQIVYIRNFLSKMTVLQESRQQYIIKGIMLIKRQKPLLNSSTVSLHFTSVR